MQDCFLLSLGFHFCVAFKNWGGKKKCKNDPWPFLLGLIKSEKSTSKLAHLQARKGHQHNYVSSIHSFCHFHML